LKGVLESTIKAMINQGATIETIRAAIGPCLGQENYEVGEEFIPPFVEEDARAISFFTNYPTLSNKNSQKRYFNLLGYVEFRLMRAGIEKINKAAIDTYAEEEKYFSFRRATHRREPDYGRQISAIMIRSS
jgi:polyphenol oxidase